MALGVTPQQIIDKDTNPLLRINPNWERIEIDNLAKVQNGHAFSSKYFSREYGMPLIRIRDIQRVETENLYSGEFDEAFIVNNKDVLIGMDGDFKASKWPGKKGLLNQRVCRLIFESKYYDEDFFFICLQPYLDAIHQETSAVTVKHLSSKTIKQIPIPLPPLPEQRAIILKLELLFYKLDNGIKNLKIVEAQLKIYRQAVLKKAFEGELTNSKMVIKKLGDECEIIMGQSPPGSSYNDEGIGVPLINGPVEFGEGPLGNTIKSKWTTKPKKMCQKDDLILCVRGSTTGKTNIASFKACVGRGVAAIRYSINQKYLNSYMLLMRYEIFAKGTGTTFPSVSSKELKEFVFPYCGKKDQNQIVEEIDRRLSVCDKIEESIEESF